MDGPGTFLLLGGAKILLESHIDQLQHCLPRANASIISETTSAYHTKRLECETRSTLGYYIIGVYGTMHTVFGKLCWSEAVVAFVGKEKRMDECKGNDLKSFFTCSAIDPWLDNAVLE